MANGITEQDVWKAADALLLEGLRPTIERVRQKIGRGSPNTVQPCLDTWYKGLGARIRDPQAFSVPSAIPDPVTQAASHFWQAAQAAARAEVQSAREQLNEETQALETERQALISKEAALNAQLDATSTALSLATVQLEEARQRETVLQSTVGTLDQRNSELSASLDAARAQLDLVRVDFDRERQETTERTRLQEQHWQQEVDRQRQATKEARQRMNEVEKQLQTSLHAAEARALTAERLAADHQLEINTLRAAQLAQSLVAVEMERMLAQEQAKLVAAQSALNELRRQKGRGAIMQPIRPRASSKRTTRV